MAAASLKAEGPSTGLQGVPTLMHPDPRPPQLGAALSVLNFSLSMVIHGMRTLGVRWHAFSESSASKSQAILQWHLSVLACPSRPKRHSLILETRLKCPQSSRSKVSARPLVGTCRNKSCHITQASGKKCGQAIPQGH